MRCFFLSVKSLLNWTSFMHSFIHPPINQTFIEHLLSVRHSGLGIRSWTREAKPVSRWSLHFNGVGEQLQHKLTFEKGVSHSHTGYAYSEQGDGVERLEMGPSDWMVRRTFLRNVYGMKLLKLGCVSERHRILSECRFWFRGLMWGLRFCIFNELSGDANVSGPHTLGIVRTLNKKWEW